MGLHILGMHGIDSGFLSLRVETWNCLGTENLTSWNFEIGDLKTSYSRRLRIAPRRRVLMILVNVPGKRVAHPINFAHLYERIS
jgi:hypothetical protein